MSIIEVRPDDAALRVKRRERVVAAMEDADIDVLVLGREANARYVAGAPRLWLAGTRPFGPGCVLVRHSGAVHLMSTWDEGVPEDIPHEHLYGISFNAANYIEALRDVEGAATARRVATDAMSAGAVKMLSASFPAATFVDGDELMARVRRTKLAVEIDAIRAAVGVAEVSLQAAMGHATAGVTENEVTGRFMEAMASEGVTIPSTQDVAWVTSPEHPWRRTRRGDALRTGDLVVFEAGVIRDGYVGELGRTAVVGEPGAAVAGLLGRRDDLWRRLLERCRPGVSAAELLTAYTAAGVDAPPMPVARGLGLGYDRPMVSTSLPDSAAACQLEPGMVLALVAFVWEPGVGAAFGQEPVVITEDGPEVLTTEPFAAP